MGHKNFDRWTAQDWRATAETVEAMLADHWDVIAHCATCNLTIGVDLRVIAALRGPSVSLWNRQAPCKRIGCAGVVEFRGRPPQSYRHFALRAEWPKGMRPMDGLKLARNSRA